MFSHHQHKRKKLHLFCLLTKKTLGKRTIFPRTVNFPEERACFPDLFPGMTVTVLYPINSKPSYGLLTHLIPQSLTSHLLGSCFIPQGPTLAICLWTELSALGNVESSAESQPTELRRMGAFLSFCWVVGEGGTSLDGGKRSAWLLIITVITFWIGSVPGRNQRLSEFHLFF